MARPISSLPKPLALYFGIALLSISLCTGCAGSTPSESPTHSVTADSSSPPTVPVLPTVTADGPLQPATPTPVKTATGAASPCPPDGEAGPLPDISFDAVPEAVLSFLNAGGSKEELNEALFQAGVANLPEPTAAGDMDGDGWEELVVSIFEPESVISPPGGMLLIYTCRDGDYHQAYLEDTRPSDGAPVIRFLRDINADGQDDLVVSSATCGAHTCFERVQVIQWDGAAYRNHLEGETADLPYPTIYLSPTLQDGVYELQVTGSGIGSVGAGPQRNVTRTWSFSEEAQLWLVSGFKPEPSNYRIHILHDAVAAAKTGDFQQALGLYNRVISDSTLEDWSDPDLEQAWINAFARYQMSVIYTLQDRETFANTVLAELQNTTPGTPQSGYYDLAVAYIDGYRERGIEDGCQHAMDYASAHPDLLDPLGPQVFGYGNRAFTEADICP